ncbi:MAG: hypothetical protein R2844_01490 [Caldilineales bacterium]
MSSPSQSPARLRGKAAIWLIAGLVLGIALTIALQAVAQEGGGSYDPQLDVNHDGVIDTLDIQSTAGPWGTTGDPMLVNLTTRGYYQTSATVAGNAALTACAAGYHMANMAEIQNTSALRYAKEIPGAVQGQDSGNGPPFSITGWIRTGVSSNTSTQVGAGNCALWTSNSAGHNGTTVALQPNWLLAGDQPQPVGRLTGHVQHAEAGGACRTERSELAQNQPGLEREPA